jgi:hypothetical protein
MHKPVGQFFVVVGLILGSVYGMQGNVAVEQPKESCKAAAVTCTCYSVLAAFDRIVDLDHHRTNKEFACSAYTPISCNDKLKNLLDQGLVCYALLKFLRAAETADLSGEGLVEAVVVQNQIIPVLQHLDDIGNMRLLWAFLVDERKLEDTKESQAMYYKDPVVWYRTFRDKIVAVLQENRQLIQTFQGRFYYDSMLGEGVLRLEGERLALQKAYARAVLDVITWLEVLATIKDEKSASNPF